MARRPPGDVFNVPAERVHSIGAGILLAQGVTVLVPACVRTVEIRPEGGVKLLECGV